MAVSKKVKKAAETAAENEVVETVEEAVDTTAEEITEAEEATVDETVESENTETVEVEESGETELTVDTSAAAQEPEKTVMVKIKPNCNYRFYYGNTWYVLCKEVVMTVPEEVKAKLQEAGKLMAL